MWRAVLILTLALVSAAPAVADDVRLDWPLRPAPAVVRGFDAPSPDWKPGHRGVDLSGSPGQRVYAAGSATVVFTGVLAGRPVVSLAHPGGLRTSYEPVRAAVVAGQQVTAQTVIGELRGRARRLCGRGVFALGRDVGSGVGSRLCRSTGPAEIHPGPAQTAEPVAGLALCCYGFVCAARALCGPKFRPARTLDPISAHSTRRSGPRVSLIVHRTQPGHRHVGVQLGRRQAGMAQQLLNDPQVGPAFQ